MSPWATRVQKSIPSIGSKTGDFSFTRYVGMNTYSSDDDFPKDRLRLAQNARIVTLGDYDTRKGTDFHSDAVGETIDVQQTSTTGAADQNVSTTVRVAKKITFTTTGRNTRLDVNLKNSAAATGTVIIELWSNSSGSPGTLLGRSSVASGDIGSSYAYEIARLIHAPAATATDYWCVVYAQTTGTGSYKISSTTNASTGLVSTDSGATWSAANVDFNVKAYLSTNAAPKGLFRGSKSDGTVVTLLAAGTVLYSINETTGALTSIKTGLSASATNYRFVLVNDIVYYVNGFDGLRKWDFTTEAQVSATNYTHIIEHKGMLFLVTKDDPNKVVFSNFAVYETFTSTDFIYVPSPKTGDPVTAVASLNGSLVIWTRFRKWILYGSDNATYQLEEAPGKKPTHAQETVATDKNFAYFLSDDGLYSFNGTEDKLLSAEIYEDIKNLPNKDSSLLSVVQGRLRLYYSLAGESANSHCWVLSLNFDCVESLDTDTPVSFAAIASNDDGQLLIASSLVGQTYWQELESNDYTNLGDDIDFDLRTNYMHFGSPVREKEIRYWAGSVGAQSGSYDLSIQYAYDLRDNWQTLQTVSVQGAGSLWGTAVWGAFTWGTSSEVNFSTSIPNAYRRIAVGYKHYATRQPQKFLSHDLKVQTRRLR